MTAMNGASKATVVISFDFEIGWGDVTNENWRMREATGVYKRLRAVLPEILAEMDRLDIPATWATVGAMIDDPERLKLDHLPARARSIVDNVLATANPDSFDGRDLFAMVKDARANHRIACHSYSHVPFTYEGVDEAFVSADLQAFKATLERWGYATDRFVFPENIEGFHDALKKSGFKVVRVAANTYFRNRFLYLASIPFVPPPAIKRQVDDHGLQHHFGSMLFNDARRPAVIPLLRRRFKLGLRSALSHGEGFHIWAHPFNFAESPKLKDAFLDSLREIAQKRDSGQLEITHM